MSQKKFSSGTSMIEVLVAIVILSFALLGIAGLLSATTRFQMNVESRSSLPMFFNDLTGRMRTNMREVPGARDASASPTYSYTANWAAQRNTQPAAPSKLCGLETGAVACTSAELAAYDLWQTRTAVQRVLPQGALQINGDAREGIRVSYIWFDKNNVDSSAIVAATNPTGLVTAPTCSAATTGAALQNCCPVEADVSSNPGVRCVNFTFIP